MLQKHVLGMCCRFLEISEFFLLLWKFASTCQNILNHLRTSSGLILDLNNTDICCLWSWYSFRSQAICHCLKITSMNCLHADWLLFLYNISVFWEIMKKRLAKRTKKDCLHRITRRARMYIWCKMRNFSHSTSMDRGKSETFSWTFELQFSVDRTLIYLDYFAQQCQACLHVK